MKVIRIHLIFILVLLSGCRQGTDCNKLLNEIIDRHESGMFTEAARLADSLKMNCPDKKPGKLCDSLIDIEGRIRLDFPRNGEQFLERTSGLLGYLMTDSMQSSWNSKGWIEWKLIDGEKMFFSRAATNLIRLRKFYEDKEKFTRELAEEPAKISRLKHTAEVLAVSGNSSEPVVPADMKINYTITVNADAVPAGEIIRCWMPFPKEDHLRQKDVALISASLPDYVIAPDSAIHRTVYMESRSVAGTPATFSITYSYRSFAQYFDLSSLKIKPYDKTSALYKINTAEQLPQICFAPEVREMADKITGPSDEPVEVVRKIYMWFKENIPWTGALEYSIIPNIPLYVLEHRRGDCGQQTLLFMSMLRYKGIPVRWQSGWMVPPGDKNLHDWCEVYFEGPGWIPVDVSYDLQYTKDPRLKEFFMSGLDSYRLIVNDGISGSLYPEKKFMRSEPYDFQRGEVEWSGGNLYFDKWDYSMKIEYLK